MPPFACGGRHNVVRLSIHPSVGPAVRSFILGFFFSFNVVTSLDYISLRAWRVRPGGLGQGQFDYFFARGAGKTNLNNKAGSRQFFFFNHFGLHCF